MQVTTQDLRKSSRAAGKCYGEYRMNLEETIVTGGEIIMLTIAVAYLFYRNILAGVMIVFIAPVIWKRVKAKKIKQQKQILCIQFKDAIQSVASAMQAGYSLENCWREAQRDIERLHGKKSIMCQELGRINGGTKLNMPLEQRLMDFAVRSECDDIVSFCQVFQFAKRSGGNFAAIMRTTASRIQARMSVQREIETVLAAKKLEQKIMNIIPLGILAYLNLTSHDYLNPMYNNPLGIAVMTVSLMVYVVAVFWSEKIMNIDI